MELIKPRDRFFRGDPLYSKTHKIEFTNMIREKMGRWCIYIDRGKYHVRFNERTPDWQILPDFKLHDFLTRNDMDSRTMIDVLLLLELERISEEFGRRKIHIMQTYSCDWYCRETDPRAYKAFTEGCALDIVPDDPKLMGELQKACRRANNPGGLMMFKDFIRIDTFNRKRWREVDPWANQVKPSEMDDWIYPIDFSQLPETLRKKSPKYEKEKEWRKARYYREKAKLSAGSPPETP